MSFPFFPVEPPTQEQLEAIEKYREESLRLKIEAHKQMLRFPGIYCQCSLYLNGQVHPCPVHNILMWDEFEERWLY